VREDQASIVERDHAGTDAVLPHLMAFYVHHVRGRLRAKFVELIDDPGAMALAVARIRRIPGVAFVQGNPILGSLIIEYRASVLSPDALVTQLGENGLALWPSGSETRSARRPHAEARPTRLIDTVVGSAVEAIVRGAVLAVIAG